MKNVSEFAKNYVQDLKSVLDQLPLDMLDGVVAAIEAAHAAGKQIFIIGNGGSAATASHMMNDLNKGTLVWQIAHGETPDNIKNHPALKGVTIPRTGRQGRIGVLVTRTLAIAGEGGFATTANGRGAMLRAYDKATGQELGAVFMPAPQTGSPMTYLYNGKQYLVLAISGQGYSAELIAFRLPNS